MSATRAREQRVRRAADLQGLRLVKSRTRTPGAPDYGRYWLTECGTGPEPYTVPIGGEENLFAGSALAEVEAYLRSGDWWRAREEREREREQATAIVATGSREMLAQQPRTEPLSEPRRARSEPEWDWDRAPGEPPRSPVVLLPWSRAAE